jgi:hypothetical protein
MPETNLRALFAELLDWTERTSSDYYKQADVIIRARAALSQPEPVVPTDEDLEDLAEVMNVSGNPVPAMRRALELWGNSQGILASSPQPEPGAPAEAASRVSHYLEQRRLIRGLDAEVINALHAGTDEPRQAALTVSDLEALACWGTPAIKPVPVSERLPRSEDCDSDGFCWFWDYGWTRQQRGWHDDECTHWLPHWALPVPAPANNTREEI